jgi:hypothetical protein
MAKNKMTVEISDEGVSIDGGKSLPPSVVNAAIDAVKSKRPKNFKEEVASELEGQGLKVERDVQVDLEGNIAVYPMDVDAEDYTVLTFTCGSWYVKVREDKLQDAIGDCEVRGLVQKRLRAEKDEYPLPLGVFDRWVERFTKELEDYR